MKMKQVIVANKSLNMSPGKLAAMVSHGSIAFLTNWLKENVKISDFLSGYKIKEDARFDPDTFNNWVNGNFTKVILEAANTAQMEEIIEKAHVMGMKNQRDFFNIVDDSTEFEDIPCWAVIAFRPLAPEDIDPITGKLNLYGHEPNEKCLVPKGYDDDDLPFK